VASVPGPGQYLVPGSTMGGPAFTLRGKPRERAQEDLPGPGQYGGNALRWEGEEREEWFHSPPRER
jgi:hypothetical protein